MVTGDEKEEPFGLDKDQCWVTAENQELKAKDAHDSQTFGPISIADIGELFFFLNIGELYFKSLAT
ncbi:hypothetical protein Bca4012_029904 [Brassica carinata]|uniref:Uncharacterized protein n=2 Tax=Brassica TaxID=3705 RepID=A0A8X7RLD1_BRACI|nr:hypothetical protein Bca52824_048686 [Brassica carinata]KAG2289083.1 hypothetical protein Bca52824_048687 [Brassica carinata]VDD07305.1 unnamed protein product [Brassica oleracea]